jgi:uncharacterized protein YbjQ (UPF0145 family)
MRGVHGLELDSSISAFGRVATLAGAYRLDLTAFLDRLAALAPELGRDAIITVPSTFDRVGVATKITRGNDGIDRVRVLARTCDAEQPDRLARLFGAETHELVVELESMPHDPQAFALIVTGYGKRSLSADLAELATFGLGGELARLEELATALVGADKLIGLSDRADTTGARAWTIHVAHRNGDDAQRAATRERIGAVAATLGIGAPQRNLVAGLHDALNDGRDSYSWLRVRPEVPGARLGMLWAGVRWEDVVNIATTLYPRSGCSARLGELAGAFGAGAAAGVELELTTVDPPSMRVLVTLAKGRAQS